MSKSLNRWLHSYRWQLKTLLHLALLSPLAYCLSAVLMQWWGGDPVQQIIHYLANSALNILLLSLCLAPLSRRYKIPALLAFRRLIGLYVFAYACLHLSAYLLLDLALDWSLFVEELVKRPYIWVGMLAFIVLLAMAATSFKALQQRMGQRWLQLHGFIYPLSLLVVLHFWWSLKSGYLEPLIYALVFLALFWPRRKQISRWYKSFARG